MKRILAAVALVAGASLSNVWAATIAVFGNNDIATFLSTTNTVTVVNNADLESPSFLTPFDLFIYTRDGASLGGSLSPNAAANVQQFVTGRVVLFTSDLQDDGFPAGGVTATLLTNAVSFVTVGGKGYIGELVGSCAAMSQNNFQLQSLSFFTGACDYPFLVESGGQVLPQDPIQILEPDHPVVAGLTGPLSLGVSAEVFARLTGVPQDFVIAVSSEGIPAIVGTPVGGQPVPEPGMLWLWAAALAAITLATQRRRASARSGWQ